MRRLSENSTDSKEKYSETHVPKKVQPPELMYVTQLYGAYNTTGLGLNIRAELL